MKMSSLLVLQKLWFVLPKRSIYWKKKVKKKHVDEELAYGKYSNILQELLLQDREHFRKYLRMNTTTFEVFLVFWCFFIHLFYFKRWIGFSLNFLYVSKIKTVWNICWWWIFIICKTSSFHLIVFSFSVFISFSSTIIYFWWRFERFQYFERLKLFRIGLQIKSIWFDEHAWRIQNTRKNTFFPNSSKKFFIEIRVKFEKNSERMQNSS